MLSSSRSLWWKPPIPVAEVVALLPRAPPPPGSLITTTLVCRRRDCTAQATPSGRRALEEPAQRGGLDPKAMRPWQFDLPSLAEMAQPGWVAQVRDWELFWARHKVWQGYVQHRARRNARPRTVHEEWWGLHDLPSVEAVRANFYCLLQRACMHACT